MTVLSKLFGRSQVPSVQEIVEKLLPMRIMNRCSWDDIRQWLGGVLVDLDPNETNRFWLEIQEKCRIATYVFFYQIAKRNGLTEEAAIDFAEKWTVLTNFWFAGADRPVNRETHLLRLDREPEVEIDLLVAEIERQDRRVVRHLAEMWKTDPEIGRALKTLRWMQIEGRPTSEMNKYWDTMIFSSWDKSNI